MSNPIFNLIGGSAPIPKGPNMLDLFRGFASSVRGNPQTLVQSLLDSGRMSQEQFKQFGQMADSILKK